MNVAWRKKEEKETDKKRKGEKEQPKRAG
ncbi:hypothetical protein ARB_01143 [Trichophyton benhamiae CBS 112371]|uniref:Uncharacterized protein n=1 Tax=Arthroderma benhamiae (strain ATCC MYA-4681 / CBS 112371) TaxID=663331 RepID=D4AY74_ARTBC|nr:hypothetical protein ARB_01143 [Trichophyton benhamiae CBS 112371]